MRANIHRGRTNAKGQAFSAKHNDRHFPLENAEHIDPSLTQKNVVWKFDKTVDEYNLKSLDNYEQSFYEKYFSTTLDKRNDKQIANRHKDRVQTIEQFRANPKYCPEEDIFNIGKNGDTVDPEIVKQAFEEYVQWHKIHFPNVIILDAALHVDEPNAAPHIQSRQVWIVERNNEDGQTYLDISQKDALAAMGIERPDPNKKESKYNNAKMIYTAITREKWLDIAESHGLEIEREPQDKSLSGLTLLQLKVRTAKEELRKTEENLDMLNGIGELVKQQLTKDVETLNAVKEEIDTKREEMNDLDEQILAAVEIPPRPVEPKEPPPIPAPPMKYQVFSREEEREYNESRKVYDRAVKQRDKDLKKYHQDHSAWEKDVAEWDNRFQPLVAAKNVMAKAAAKIDEAEEAKRQAQQMQKQVQAELERGRAEIEKGKRANDKRSREMDVEVGQRVQEELARTDKFQRFMVTSAEFDRRIEMLYKGADKRNEKAFEDKVKAMQKGVER